LRQQPIPARPASDVCSVCSVRQICKEYWEAAETTDCRWAITDLMGLSDGDKAEGWRDLQVNLAKYDFLGRRLEAQIDASSAKSDKVPLRLVSDVPERFRPGSTQNERQVRLLSVGVKREANTLHIL